MNKTYVAEIKFDYNINITLGVVISGPIENIFIEGSSYFNDIASRNFEA
ncbi:hypothetical protein GAMM_170100 [Gammaproteobacteria bacterium]